MLKPLPEITNEETLLLSFDVINFYTNNQHDYVIEAIKLWLGKYFQGLLEYINKVFIIETLKFILEKNYFLFEGNCFQ